MDIHQAAKALVKQIDTTGKLPTLPNGVCAALSIAGAGRAAYAEIFEMLGTDGVTATPVWRSYIDGLGASGEWNETRMTLLALLAETCAEDFKESAIE